MSTFDDIERLASLWRKAEVEVERLRETVQKEATRAEGFKAESLRRKARLRRIEEAVSNARVIGFEPGIAKIDSGSWSNIRAALGS